MSGKPLTTNENLFDFFHERVDSAALQHGSPVSEEGVFYLSNLLVERGRVNEVKGPGTLVELHALARESDRVRAIQAYRELGDRALYISGFFPGSVERRTISLQYYMEMGASAYDRLASILSAPQGMLFGEGHKALDEIFGELACSFDNCSRILRQVRSEIQAMATDEDNDQDVLALYEEWLATGSEVVADRLRALGVIPIGRSDSC
jgi:hypothetical protein